MPDDRRHLQFFGPDFARGPFPGSVETVGVQIGTILAQLRVPLLRSDDQIRAHADFIRELADRLMPDWAAQLRIDVGAEISNTVQATIRAPASTVSLLHCWLADASGGGETSLSPDTVTWNSGVVLQTITTSKRYLVLTTGTGLASVTVGYSGVYTWQLAVARHGRVIYSPMAFK